jgi:hypothetical protein
MRQRLQLIEKAAVSLSVALYTLLCEASRHKGYASPFTDDFVQHTSSTFASHGLTPWTLARVHNVPVAQW